MPAFQPRIAIAGGGPAGLALGQLLHRHGVRATIYERQAEFTQEELAKPSGMLDLHEESGLRVMRECGLWDRFTAALGDCSEAWRVLNPQGTLLHSDDGRPSARPEIARNALVNLLIQSVPADAIKWNHKIASIQSNRNATTGATEVTLDLGVNGVATYDFVVGADGAWSRVRKLLSDVKPFYSGGQILTATARHASTKYPHLVELVGSGMLHALGGGNGIVTHRGPQDSIQVHVTLSTPDEHWAQAHKLEGKPAAEIKTALLSDDKLFRKWAPELQELLATACDEETKDNPGGETDIMPLYMLPVDFRWEHQIGATLVGDAAHLMTPWAGEGANLALWDSLDLAHVLSTVPETAADAAAWQAALEPRLREFEETMLARAQAKAEETLSNKELLFSENGAEALADFLKEMAAAAGGEAEGQSS